MKYTSELKPKATKDLKSIPPKERERIVTRIERMEEDLAIKENLEDYEDLKELREAKAWA